MRDKARGGFTIIEAVLFLAVTGVIMATLLVGLSVPLNRERYRDAVNSFEDYLQGQYNQVINVNNSRDSATVCTAGGIKPNQPPDAGPGTSDCVIVGRIIHSTANGASVVSAKVFATHDTFTGQTNDVSVLTSADLVMDVVTDTYSLGWSTKIVEPGTTDVQPFSILIVRMPTNGTIHTYASSSTGVQPKDLIGQVPAEPGTYLCVDSVNLVPARNRVGLLITPDAPNSSGVRYVEEGTC